MYTVRGKRLSKYFIFYHYYPKDFYNTIHNYYYFYYYITRDLKRNGHLNIIYFFLIIFRFCEEQYNYIYRNNVFNSKNKKK